MNDAPSHLDDDRLSALVDGVAEPEDAAHAASCLECGARLAAWQAVVSRVAADPVVPDDGRLDQAVAAALDAGTDGSVTDLSEVRRRRGLRPPAAAGVAAALVLLAGLNFGLAQIGSGSNHHNSTTSAGAAAPAAGNGASGSTGKAPVARNLGSFESTTALVPAVKALVEPTRGSPALFGPSSTVATPSAAGAVSRSCPAPVQNTLNRPFVAEANLTFKGVPSIVSVFTGAGGHTAVVTSTSCAFEAEFSFP